MDSSPDIASAGQSLSGRIIDLLGGTSAVAAFFEVGLSTVSDWRVAGIPRARLRHLRDVRPDVLAAAQRSIEESR